MTRDEVPVTAPKVQRAWAAVHAAHPDFSDRQALERLVVLCTDPQLPRIPAEQTAIATYLDEKTVHIDRIVSTINTQIDKLKELRKALINDVVTGKIKVA